MRCIKIIFFVFIILLFLNMKVYGRQYDLQTKKASETFSMVSNLRELINSGDPLDYYHWNRRLAAFYKSQIPKTSEEEQLNYWFMYCDQLLKAGENQLCINEIEKLISNQSITYEALITSEWLPIVGLLGTAYLRQGEIINCQNNHNAYSCILPLDIMGFHKELKGSKMAIEIFSKMYDEFPNDTYKWLINLAYMTIGEYPENVLHKYYIKYPNWEKETKSFPRFEQVSTDWGIDQDGLSGGVSLDDFNNDGYMDIFITSYGMEDQSKLYINTGGKFIDATNEAGLTGIISGLNCIQADYDNDGDVDLLVLRGAWLGEGGNHPNSLLKNNGDGSFIDVTKTAGILSFYPTQTAAWADVNKDGYLDLFIGNESLDLQSNYCELYINQQNGQFLEMSADYQLDTIKGFVKGVVFGDINNDQWPDLYISVLGGENLLYRNDYGKFTNISKSAGVRKPIYSFPTWFWDVNNDGYEDLLVASYDTRNLKDLAGDFAREVQEQIVLSDKIKLYINNGDETFSDQTKEYGLDISSYAMGSNFGDLDNDGWLDFYLGTGSPEFTSVIPNRMFKNIKGIRFEEVTSAGGFGHIQKGHGISFADLDNDGDQDIYTVLGGAFEGDNYPNVCFKNPNTNNNWIVLRLEGVKSNKSAIGTRLKIELENGRTIYHSINTGGSFGGNSLQAEIGLGQSKAITKLTISWPNSKNQVFKRLVINKAYKIIEGKKNIQEISFREIKLMTSDSEHKHKQNSRP